MVAIFTGSGTGFERGSGNVLGSSGLLGSSGFGRSGSQVFLNAANGNLLINRQDEFLVGRGPDAGVARTYNSLGDMSDDNGDNWRQSTQRAVRLNGAANSWGSSVTHRMGDGSEVAYYWNGSAYTIAGGAGIHDKVVIDGAVLRWTDGDSGIVETYENDGVTEWRRLKTVADTSGNAVTYGYTGDKLTSITTADGGTIQYSWAGSHITQVNSGDGTLTRYLYDSYDRLSQVDIELTSGGGVYSTIYTYHGSSKLVATISETDGASVSIGYDSDNRVTSLVQTVSSGVTRTTSLVYGEGYTSVTDPAGQVTTLWYDWTGALVQITAPPAYAGAAQQTVTFGYNEDGDLSSVTDALGQHTNYVRDSWGNVVFETDRLDNILLRTFNAAHKTLTETRLGAGTTRYVYDSLDRLVYVITPEGRVTRNWYDTAGQLYFISDFPDYLYDLSGFADDEAPTQVQLNNWCDGLPETASSEIAYMLFDERGNVKQRRQASQNNHYGSPNTAGGYSDEFFTYDSAGRLLTRRIEGQATESFVYDGLGRITASTDLNGGTTSFVFNDAATQTVVTLANGFVQTSTYNKTGELVGFTEAGSGVIGGTASYQYDSLGRLRVVTDASGLKTYYVYDKAGRKVAEAHGSGTFTEYRYDANNRLAATIRYGLGNSGAQVSLLQDPNSTATIDSLRPVAHPYDIWTWNVYDKEGRVVEAIEGDGSVTTYQYDAAGRLIRTTGYFNKLSAGQIAALKAASPTTPVLPGAHANDSVARTFYDKDGNFVGMLNGEGYLSRIVYDGAGRKVQELSWSNPTNVADRANGSLQTLINGVGADARTMRYVYDGQGLLRFQIDSLFHVTEFGYGSGADAHGPVRQTIEYAASIAALSSYTYAAVKSAVAGFAGHADNRLSFGVYDGAGRLAYSIDAGGGVIGYVYDAMGQPVRKVEYANLRWTGSLPTKAEMDSWVATYPTVNDRITRYFYNGRGELRFTVDAEGYVTQTDYDAEGRMAYSVRWDLPVAVTDSSTLLTVAASVTGTYAATSWTYDDAGRLATVTDPESIVRHYYYYGNGKLAHEYIAEGQPDQSRTMFIYDQAGRLAARYDGYDGTPGQALTTFAYDGLGNLISTTDPNSHTTSWTYDKLGRKLTETNAASGVTSFEYNGFGDLVRTIDARLNSTWNYYDKMGRVVATRDAEDYVTETEYTAFGEVESVTRRANRATNTASATVPPAVLANTKDATTSFVYDKLGRVKTTTDAESYVETNWYDAFGGVVQTQNKLGGITQYAYNNRGLLVQEWVGAPVYDALGNQTAPGYYKNYYRYDARGNLAQRTEAVGLAERRDTVFTYDKANRLILKEGTPVPVGQSGTMTTPAEHYAYDKRGNLIESWDAAGGHAWYWYDDLDRKSAEIVAVTATQGTYSAYSYDAVGNLKSSKVYGGWASLPASAGGAQPSPPAGEYRETTFDYDNINRLLSQSVAGQAIGYWQNGSYVYTSGTLTTSYQYDAVGNVVKTTDPALVSVYSYYDKLGRKTAEVDALGYATSWERDAEGNVLTERRYSGVASGISTSGYTAPNPATSDRVTLFTYDKMGRRLTEARSDVAAWTLDTANGQLDPRTGTSAVSTIQYGYNALGQVTSKIEATGDTTTYVYDSAGRLIREHRNGFVDYAGTAVTPSVRYYYNGLDGLVRTEQGGASASGADRVTTNSYGAGGRLIGTTDAANNVRSYIYDAAGRKTGEYYTRDLGNGTSVTEGLGFEYDRAGNQTRQSVNTIANGVWAKVSDTTAAFNAYGEMITRGTNGGAQEQFVYDGAGRLIRTNSGDGVWRHFVYDAVGHQTLMIESEGMDLSGLSQATAYNNASTDGVNTTVTVYDKRGQATGTIQRLRETSVGSTRQDIAIDRAYNAFGEMLWEEDAYDRRTDYSYNNMGRVTQIQRPSVTVTAETGAQSSIRPTDRFFYDISGRLIGTQDANSVAAESQPGTGYKTTRQLLAGTGYGGSEALVVMEWHPDGKVANAYDVFGDLRTAVDEIERVTSMAWNKLGQLTQVTRPGGFDEYYSYDLLGNRIGHWNEVTGYAARERTEYDAMGRVTKQLAFGGDVTTTSYQWSSSIATSGMGIFGGWSATTTYANGLSGTEHTDMFGHVTWKSDLGGHITSTTYDLAGRMTGRTTSGAHGTETASYAWLSNGQVGTVTTSAGGTTTQSSSYDKSGNKLTEYTTRGGVVIQNATSTYDALNRLVTWSEAGSASNITPAANVSYEYDANSNVRRTRVNFTSINPFTGEADPYGIGAGDDHWYAYDKMNRMTIAEGMLRGISGGVEVTGDDARGIGAVERGLSGVSLAYDKAGQRTQAISTTASTHEEWDPNAYDPNAYGGSGGNTGNWVTLPTTITVREDYFYRPDGQLETIRVGEHQAQTHWNGTTDPIVIPAMGGVRASYSYDALNRLQREISYRADGVAAYDRTIGYDTSNRIATETVDSRNGWGSDVYRTITVNNYGSGIGYALGAIISSTADTYKNGNDGAVPDTSTTNSFAWFDGAVVSYISYSPGTGGSPWTTNYGFTPSGTVATATIADGVTRTVSYIQNATGEIIRRDEPIGSNGAYGLDPHQVWYRFNGREMGNVINTYGTGNPLNARFGKAYTPLSDFAHGGNAGYSAKAGDTLSSVASQLWGDSSLWFKLAEANGVSGDVSLAEGQHLTIPANVVRNSNRADTFKPYNPAEMLGNTSPTTPAPPTRPGGCGAFGAILMVAVAVAVVAILRVPVTNLIAFGTTAPAGAAGVTAAAAAAGVAVPTTAAGAAALAGTAATIAGGAIAGAAGSIASQGFGVAAGIQDKFDWKGVALAGISGGIGGGLAGTGAFNGLGKVASAGLRGALANAATQGIGVATGLQSRFDFAGVAAAGAGAMAGTWMGGRLNAGPLSDLSARNIAANITTSAAAGLANAAARSLLNGSDFGDNILAALPDVIGQTIGQMVADGMAGMPGEAGPSGIRASTAPDSHASHLDDDEIVVTARKDLLEKYRRERRLNWERYGRTHGLYVSTISFTARKKPARQEGPSLRDQWVRLSSPQYQIQTSARRMNPVSAPNPGMLSRITGGALSAANYIAGNISESIDGIIGSKSLYQQWIGQPFSKLVTPYVAPVADPILNEVGGFLSDPEVGRQMMATPMPLVEMAGFGGYVVAEGYQALRGISQTFRGMSAAAERSIAAQSIWEARSILRNAGLNPAQRGEVIRSFDLQTFRVERTVSESKAYRLFDDTTARLEGRYVSGDFFANQTDRIQNFALMGNSATRLGEVTIPSGSVIFTGRVAPQLRFSPGLTGGANQTFLTGPLSPYTFREIPMPR